MHATARRRSGRPKFSRLLDAYQQAHPFGSIWRLSPYHQAHLLRFFARRPLIAITTKSATDYAMKRQDAGTTADLVNEELRALGHLLRFAVQRGELSRVPEIWFVPTSRPPRDDGRPSTWFFAPSSRAVAGAGPGAVSPARRGQKQKLSDETLANHVDRHKLDKRHKDGRPFSVNDRRAALKNEDKVEISRAQLTKRLNAYKKTVTPV